MYLDIKMDKNKTVAQTIPASFTGVLYTLKGTIFVGDDEFEGKAHHTLAFSEDGTETVKITTKDEYAHFVFIAGEPLKEPIVQHGPFVMNTKEEIYGAIRDYHSSSNGFERAKDWSSTIA
ncbi:hypothetical protein BGZ83_009589 [Gryganskiella cystojenkinii]|nr:hypothetical protein BGZ83_009589 [Gryganskiella cystojenkinii]